FALEGDEQYENPTFRRSNAWEATKQEVMAVRNAVGINEVHNFSKYRVTGADARSWLDKIMAGRVPKQGRMSLTPMLSPKGKLIGDFTISCLAKDDFRLTASYGMQAFHMRWFQQNLPETGVQIENTSDTFIGFQVAGPLARKLLERTTRTDVSPEAFKFMDVKPMSIGLVDAIVQRVSYTGGLGFEIFADPGSQRALYQVLSEAGADLGLRPFGMRAMMSLRLDRFFGSWAREFCPDYTPCETGMDRFVSWNKPVDFIGKIPAMAEKAAGAKRKLCVFEVDAGDADVIAYEPIWLDGDVVGFCTSGGYSHYAEKSIAFGFVPTESAIEGLIVEIEILGEMYKATLITKPLIDPS
ncbi:MAG: dimethylglycine dehydrogenase, partial [Paracoccaceae bacterium]